MNSENILEHFWQPADDSAMANFKRLIKPGPATDYLNKQDYTFLGEVADRCLISAIADNLDASLPSCRNTHRARIVLRHLKRIYLYENATGYPELESDIEADLAYLFLDEYRLLESIKASIDNCWPVPDIIKSIDNYKQESIYQ